MRPAQTNSATTKGYQRTKSPVQGQSTKSTPSSTNARKSPIRGKKDSASSGIGKGTTKHTASSASKQTVGHSSNHQLNSPASLIQKQDRKNLNGAGQHNFNASKKNTRQQQQTKVQKTFTKNPKNVKINLADLSIETYDHKNGRPSLMDVNNVQMFANINMEEPTEDVFTPEMGVQNQTELL